MTVATLTQDTCNADAQSSLQQLGVTVLAPCHSRFHELYGVLLSLFRREALSIGFFSSSRLRARLQPLLDKREFDSIIVFSSSMAQYVEQVSGIPRLMHFCDVDSQKWKELAETTPRPRRWIYEREARRLRGYEQKIAAEFELSCVVSSHEAALFRRLFPTAAVHLLENGVDVDYFSGFRRHPEGKELVFVGVMDYLPNVEAAAFLVEHVWPAVRACHPAARLTIVGARPARAVTKLAAVRGVRITGYVPDVRPYLASALISVAPLAVARGIQNKILEAVAAGVPVITTPAVAKGLPPTLAELVFQADREPGSFTSAILQLLEQGEERERRAMAAQSYARLHCSWDAKVRVLDELLDHLTKGLKTGRAQQEQTASGLAP